MSLDELYKDQILFEELYKKIVNLNFDLWDIRQAFQIQNQEESCNLTQFSLKKINEK